MATSSSQLDCRPFGVDQIDWSPYVVQPPPPSSSFHPAASSSSSSSSSFYLHSHNSSNHSPSSQLHSYASIPRTQLRFSPATARAYHQSSQDQFPAAENRSQQSYHYWTKPSTSYPSAPIFSSPFEPSQPTPQFRYSVQVSSRPSSVAAKSELQQPIPLYHLSADRIMTLPAMSNANGDEIPPSSNYDTEMNIQGLPTPVPSACGSKRSAKTAEFDEEDNASTPEPYTSEEDDDDEYTPVPTKIQTKASGPKRVTPHRPTEVADKESGKPYAKLVYEALSSAPQCQMAVSEIYDYFKHHYPQFRAMKGRGWMNSIRYNLSMNEGFELVKRPDGDNGKGGLWQLTPAAQKHGIKSTTRSRQSSLPRKRQGSMRCSPRSTRRRSPLQNYVKPSYPSFNEYEEQFEMETDHSRASSYDESLGPLTPPAQETFTPMLEGPAYVTPELAVTDDQNPFLLFEQPLLMHRDAFIGADETPSEFTVAWGTPMPSPPVEFFSFDPYPAVPSTVDTFTGSNFEEQLFITRYGFGNTTPTPDTYP
ncbi:hypothetical protein EX30DRAFT_344980 [Ascodesmis nigricans]|uniref:Fork-head domain-containing protein n=1 Tax=Ascodesmis nigricans TaxID=341454 RepID=A0A4S2MMF2_9PEZI|nr:hypothetical protein EX30DRAFT_344980 [Ascodesmis nigricans]